MKRHVVIFGLVGGLVIATLAIPDSGQVAILSREEDLPLVSELIVTNVLHDQGREVQVVTRTYASQLVGRGSNSVWLQLPRRR